MHIFEESMIKVFEKKKKAKEPLKHKYKIGSIILISPSDGYEFKRVFAEIIGLNKHGYKCNVFRTSNIFEKIPNRRAWNLSLVGFHEIIKTVNIRKENNITLYKPENNDYSVMSIWKRECDLNYKKYRLHFLHQYYSEI